MKFNQRNNKKTRMWILVAAAAALLFQTSYSSHVWAQDEEDFDAAVPPPAEEEFNDAGAPPPPPPGGDFNAPPPADNFNGNNGGGNNFPTTPPPSMGGGNRFGGSGGGGSSSGGGSVGGFQRGGGGTTLRTTTPLSNGKVKFSEAQPEDITDENFPDLIESFDYPNADIKEIVKAISKLTGKNFILDNNVAGKITIIAPSQITVAEAYRAFLSALAINGFTIVPSGKFLKIRQARAAQRDAIETYAGSYFPNTDQMITRIFKLKFISADEMQKQIRGLNSKDGETFAYPPTNSLIISDYGTSVERIQNIVDQLDVPGFEEKLDVVKILYAKSKDIAELLDQIINKENRSSKSTAPRFSRPIGRQDQNSGKGAESYSLVISDERTNSIIVVGNTAGIEKIRGLIKKLDFPLRPEDSGGVYVYYVRHGEAEQIASVLNGIAKDSKTDDKTARPAVPAPPDNFGNPMGGGGSSGADSSGVFGGEIKVAADKITNSLIITSSRQDYEVVKNLLAKIDVPRDQVFVKTVIMEMNVTNNLNWGLTYYQFNADSEGIGRVGFAGGGVTNVLNPANDSGAILGFGSGQVFDFKVGGTTFKVPTLTSFLNIVKKNLGGNILSQPQLLAMDNEDAEIEVGETVPSGNSTSTSNGVTSVSQSREKATIKLTLTPYISPDSDRIRLKINQAIKQINKESSNFTDPANVQVFTDDRNIKTVISIDSGDTAVLGGLMQERESRNEIKVPILGDIPILGWLFKSKSTEKVKRNLLVFITPKIIRNEKDNDDLLVSKINERIKTIQKDFAGRDPYGEEVDNLPRRSKKKAESKGNEGFSEEPATETF